MSYLYKMEYEIIPKEAFKIIRNCSGCGCKMSYCSTGNFRVNANGNQLDVWLIYQCQKCKHTYNLTIYERVKPTDLEPGEYQSFLENQSDTALQYGLKKEIFSQNKAEIIWDDISYDIHLISEKCHDKSENNKISAKGLQNAEPEEKERFFVLNNPYGLKLRTDRLVADILQISRNKVKKMIKDGTIEVKQEESGKVIEFRMDK